MSNMFSELKKLEGTEKPIPTASSIFSDFKKSVLNESENTEATPETGLNEETVVGCPNCGIIGVLNESGECDMEECPNCGETSLVEKVVKVVRDGQVVKKKVKTKKTILTAAQKSALAKARKKAHTASANKARLKSNKIRKNRGLNDSDYVECEECGYSGTLSPYSFKDFSAVKIIISAVILLS